MNKVILKGRLARDVEMSTTTSGKALARTTIAVDRRASEKKEADFINLLIWNKLAETAKKYLGKGSEVVIEGRLQVRSYTDKEGNKRWSTDVVVENFEFCGKKSDNPKSSSSEFGENADGEDIPF